VVLAAGLAVVLCISRREDVDLGRLRRALALGASAALYFVVLRAWLEPELALDPLALRPARPARSI